MQIDGQDALHDLPAALRGTVLACARGEIPANIALMQLCMAAPDRQAVEHAIGAAGQAPHGCEIAELWRRTPGAFELVNQIIGVVDHRPSSDTQDVLVTQCAAAFDSAAALSPEASVALYSLGDPALLAAATNEIVDQMQVWDLVGAGKIALEIGCGNGRFLQALAPRLDHIVGIDISASMVGAACRRCAHLPNVMVAQSSGRDLAFCDDASLDLIFAVDSFPYIVRCGMDLVRCHFVEAKRVLKPEGRLLILNYSYRGDADQDLADVTSMSAETGFYPVRAGIRDFRLWDGVTFLLRKKSA